MPTIVIGGYYGAGNVGDEAILYAILHDLRSYDPSLNFIVLSHDPKKTCAEHGVVSIFWEDINALLEAALRCDLIILGGGGIFHDYWGIDPDKYLRRGFWDITAFGSLPLLAKLLNIPCAIMAVGVGPFKSDWGCEHTRLAFERSQIATIRDTESMDYLRKTGIQLEGQDSPIVSVFPDIVFGLESRSSDKYDVEELLEDKYSIGKDTPLLGISLRYWESETPLKERLTSIAQGVIQFLKENPQVHVVTIPFQVLNATPHTDDSIVLRELAEIINMPDRVHLINISITPHFAQALIGRCRAILGMRFHSVVMSINTGTPIVAISYAPKVQSIMESIGLAEYCNLSLAPNPDDLEKQLQSIWDRDLELRPALIAARDHLKITAQEHARTVMNFLNRIETRPPLHIAQEFALKQTHLLYNADEQIAYLQQELQVKSQLLVEIETSRFWRLVKTYYRLTQKEPFVHIRKLYNAWQNDGLRKVLERLLNVTGAWFNMEIHHSPLAVSWASKNIVETEADFETMLLKINGRSLKGVFVIGGSAIFDEIHSQRVVNMSRFLSQHGWAVIYTTGEVDNEILFRKMVSEPYDNVFHMSMDMLLSRLDAFLRLPDSKKYLVIESPHPNLFLPALMLRSQGVDIIYEITSEWEKSFSNGQAIWFDEKMEDAFVINANIVTAVSQPLLNKFSRLRQEINLIPNGYSPRLLGKKQRYGRRGRNRRSSSEIQLCYFGHLASASLDWEFLFSLLTLADAQNVRIHIHLVDYYELELKAKLKNHSDRITFHGKLHSLCLREYAKKWDVAFICLGEEKISELALTKIYEHLHLGLPVLAKGTEHDQVPPLTEFISTPSQALDVLLDIQKNGLKRFEKDKDKLETFLFEADWEQRFAKLLKTLETSK